MAVLEVISQYRVVPVIEIDQSMDAVPLGNALLDGGLPLAEITFRTEAAFEAIRSMVATFPEMCVGAGSVLSIIQAEKAVSVGAQFIVSAGFDVSVVSWCLEQKIPVFPGVATPTEVIMGIKNGLSVLKFFPSEVLGGINAVKAISAPFPHIQFIPTGGISASNLASYLEIPAVFACGGSWMVSKKLINDKRFEDISSLTRDAMVIVKTLRGRTT